MHVMNAFGRVAVYFSFSQAWRWWGEVFCFFSQPLYLQCKRPLLQFEE
jgi:hypothetical protein